MPGSPDSVLVTGGTGVVGRRIAARLVAGGARVVVLSRRHDAVMPGVTTRLGDLRDAASVRAALAGCGAVVHAALVGGGADVAATAALADLAVSCGVDRFVHISTLSVYAVPRDGQIDETSPYVPADSPDNYARTKAAVEAAVLERASRLRVAVLQPCNVVSPEGGWWTAGIAHLMRAGRMILVDDGCGIANLVGVDDVAEAAHLALEGAYASGDRFLLADGHPRPWRDYLQAIDAQSGADGLVAMTASEARAYSRRVRGASPVRRAAARLRRAVLRERLVWPMDDAVIDRFASRATVSIDRARRVLGFAPTPVVVPPVR
jgi:nucleoside-diphosphate-sugar epimerase